MYSKSANGGTSSWIVRTSTPKKMSVYAFDPGSPSTSFDPIASLPRFDRSRPSTSSDPGLPRFETAGQRSSKQRGKGSIISLICEAIEAVGSPNKGASYFAIHKWITNNRKNGQTRNLRTYIKREISKALEVGLLKRSSVSKKAVGFQGYFIINDKYSSYSSRNSVIKPKFNLTKNAKRVKANPFKTIRSIDESEEGYQSLQSVLTSIMKTQDSFEKATQSILQQATKVLEVATKLMEASNSLVLSKISDQNSTDAINPDVEMQCVRPMQPRQVEASPASMQFLPDGQARVASMQSSQSGEHGVASIQMSGGNNRVAHVNVYQAEARVAPMHLAHDEARVAPMQLVHGEARVAPMQLVHGEARVAPIQLVHGEARAAPVQLVHGEARAAPMQLVHGEARAAPMQLVHGEARVAPMQLVDGEAREAPMRSDQNEARVVLMRSDQVQARVALKRSDQVEAQVALMQSHQGKSRESSMQSDQDETIVAQVVDSIVGQSSSSLQKVNNTPDQELLDEELSVQRTLNMSSDYSFGVRDEVSNLIQHLEKNI